MIKVLIVDDSRVAQEFLVHLLTVDPAIQVVGVANNGAEAVEAVKALRPDVITMDIHMPRMDGFEATRAIMESTPTPIVIVSASTSAKDAGSTFRALEAGALAVVLRPPGKGHPNHQTAIRELLRTVKTMSEIKLVRRQPRPKQSAPAVPAAKGIRLVAIGASTGGPPVLHRILSLLPKPFAAPVLLVQHIAPGFVDGFISWLSEAAGFPLHLAEHGQVCLPGHGYVAPDGLHLGVDRDLRIMLSDQAPDSGLRPSVAHLFLSVAGALGPRAVGVLLTGMGRDGAKELKMMKDVGALTVAQDAASSVVHGMPGEALKLGAATYVLPPEGIAAVLAALIGQQSGESA